MKNSTLGILLILFILLIGMSTHSVARLDLVNDGINWESFNLTTKLVPPTSYPYQHCFKKSAEKYALPEILLAAVARGESGFNNDAISTANALGLMQIQWPQTAKHLGLNKRDQLFDPCVNVDAGTRYLKQLLKRYDNDVYRALAAYNYGPGRIKKIGNIPDGADWYSRYIYHHLKILRDGKVINSKGKLVLIEFNRSWRARAFHDAIKSESNTMMLDWLKTNKGTYQIILRFKNNAEKMSAIESLKKSGLYVY